MLKKYGFKLAIVLSILLCSAVSFLSSDVSVQSEKQKFKVFVYVDPNEEEKTEADIIESHLKRELRALGDVQIVDVEDDWQWAISIVMLGHKWKDDGTKANQISIAYTIDRRVPKFYFDIYPALDVPVFNSALAVTLWSKDDLHSWCISTANEFDKSLKK